MKIYFLKLLYQILFTKIDKEPVLKGNDKRIFEVLDLEKTGFFADGNCRNIISIRNSATKEPVIVSQNANSLKVLSFDNRLSK